MRFPTLWYVWPAKAQTSLRIRADWSEPLLVAWIFYDCKATDRTKFIEFLSLTGAHMWKVTLLEITCRGTIIIWKWEWVWPVNALITDQPIKEHWQKDTHTWSLVVRKPLFVEFEQQRGRSKCTLVQSDQDSVAEQACYEYSPVLNPQRFVLSWQGLFG